jgi:hypothetical protein
MQNDCKNDYQNNNIDINIKYANDILYLFKFNLNNLIDGQYLDLLIDNKAINNNILSYKIDSNLHNLNKYIRNNYSEFSDYTCEKCNNKGNCIKINRLLLIPTIITINFNKYSEKNNYIYPTELFFINGKENKKYNYKLISTINHSGNTNSGHYISKGFRKKLHNNNVSNVVYKMNDSSYNEDSLKPENDTYIIFYHYVETVDYFV